MGGASHVLTGDIREEVIEKAKEWYKGAVKAGLWPRDYIYGKGETEITYHDCKDKECPICGGEPLKANIIVVDTAQKPAGAESDNPFPFFSKFNSEEENQKRYHCFVSAHT